jgi:hypothetical protein
MHVLYEPSRVVFKWELHSASMLSRYVDLLFQLQMVSSPVGSANAYNLTILSLIGLKSSPHRVNSSQALSASTSTKNGMS